MKKPTPFLAACLAAFAMNSALAQPTQVPMYEVHEITFEGETYGPEDSPVAEVELTTTWVHEAGYPQRSYRIYGFWDGDGKGGSSGNVFKARFCPTREGIWHLKQVESNSPKLDGQNEGLSIECVPSDRKGFWVAGGSGQPDASKRWYSRSDGSHPYIIGNTYYSFLSEYFQDKPTGSNIRDDVRSSAQYFNKLRFGITGDIYPNPDVKPFLDDKGKPTDSGAFSHRPNPTWFHKRVDLAVQTAFSEDIIADIILNGPDVEDARSALLAAENGGDNTPFLRYMAARYGSYPNVWMCLSNEYDIKEPSFSDEAICIYGYRLQGFLPYDTPVSVHGDQRNWDPDLNKAEAWNDHVILQNKVKSLYAAADFADKNFWMGGGNKPVINDEIAYQGEGDGWSEEDVIEAVLGAFIGGSYASTGHKSGRKEGHYFAGDFRLSEHSAADNLAFMRQVIDEEISFWRMVPKHYTYIWQTNTSIFRNIKDTFRALEWAENEYVLATNQGQKQIEARLPKGEWEVTLYDIIAMEERLISSEAKNRFNFDTPDSRAVLVHFKKKD